MAQPIENFTPSTTIPRRSKRGRLTVLFGLLAIFLMIAGAGGWVYLSQMDFRHAEKAPGLTVDSGAMSFFQHVMEQDYLVGLSGGKSALAELSLVSPVEQMPSSSLAALYAEGEAMATESYKGKKVIVSGKIVAVRVDFNDDVIVELPGYDLFSNVQAVLHQDAKRYTGPILKGENVRLYCTVHGKTLADIASLVYLTDCESVDLSNDAREFAAHLTDKMNTWLHTGGSHDFRSDYVASYFLTTYLTGTRLPVDHPCRLKHASLDECVSSFESIDLRALFEMARVDLDSWRPWLGLQPLARQVSSR
ncbi:OB-fold protein [Pseudomonas sp. ZT5P21]